MKINKASASEYNAIDNLNLVRYISEHAAHIYGIIYSKSDELQDRGGPELAGIAAELETVKRRLEWLVSGTF